MVSMWPGVSTPASIRRLPLLASAIWPASAPTPTLLVCACTDSAAPLILSRNPMLLTLCRSGSVAQPCGALASPARRGAEGVQRAGDHPVGVRVDAHADV